MTSKFEDFEHEKLAPIADETTELPPDCFELLSAYIDGETTASQRHQVQTWLDRDPQVKRVYTQLLALQSQMQQSVAPPCEKSIAEISSEVFQSIDSSHRRQRRLILTGTAIAASMVAAITGISSGTAPLRMNMAARENPSDNPRTETLAIAFNKPAIDIPKTVRGYDLEINTTKN
jgi:anti-sigma factor RsiW